MKYFFCMLIIFYSYVNYGNEWRKIQLDINTISLGLQSEYFFSERLSNHIGIGIGITTVSDFYEHKYKFHNNHNNAWGSDMFGVGKSGISGYAQAGIKYIFAKIKSNKFQLYMRYQLKIFSHSFIVFPGGGENLKTNYRNGVYLGLQRFLGPKHKWQMGFEGGAALWSNYDWCVQRFGPLFNIKMNYNIF